MTDSLKRVKVFFDFFNTVLDEDYSESLCAAVVDEQKGYYALDNIPFFVESYSYKDVVYAIPEDGRLLVQDLIEESGHSTLQIISFKSDRISAVQKHLQTLGCSWEGSHLPNYFSVDVPAQVKYGPIKSYLKRQEKQEVLAYREACLAH
ncbi:DUF4265 domain-containing protein [Hymenobacter glaciei]|uniref:DUF4265 domain-containing protein n=1 Tax=Hymenobacter glaciei TaxID=877209 RepID=A0ABP7TCJ6_9BACT